MEFLAIKKKEVILFERELTETQLEIIILSQLSQSQKDRYHVFSYLWITDTQNPMYINDMSIKMKLRKGGLM